MVLIKSEVDIDYCIDCYRIELRQTQEELNKDLYDSVNHPDHYKGNKFEVIDIIEDFGLGFKLGNAIKYILRAHKKGDYKENLEKAVWYLRREIDK